MAQYSYKIVQQKLRIIYIALRHMTLILRLKILVRKTCMTMSIYESPVVYFFIKSNLFNSVYDWMLTGTLMLIHILRAHEIL